MNITKKIDRAFQWAGEKMGSEARTTMPDEFKMLEAEMALRHDGMDRLHRSTTAYVKWLGRRCEVVEDKDRGLPAAFLGRTMTAHGDDFEPDSEFGSCLVALGRANERVAGFQEHYLADATTLWLDSLERSLAMLKEYQAARKKLESRRLAYDASTAKLQKARRDDFRAEEEVRTAKTKYEESSEDVLRRMQDIKDAEADSVRDLTGFLDAELDYHERCAEELRRVRSTWPGSATAAAAAAPSNGGGYNGGSYSNAPSTERRPAGRSRSNTAHSLSERLGLSRKSSSTRINISEEQEPEPELPARAPIRSSSRLSLHRNAAPPETAARPPIGRSSTFQGGANTPSYTRDYAGAGAAAPHVGSLRGQLRPVGRSRANSHARDDVFADGADDDPGSGRGSPEHWADRSASPAVSVGSLGRSATGLTLGGPAAARKAPPPPPPSRAKKPAPPVPARREVGY